MYHENSSLGVLKAYNALKRLGRAAIFIYTLNLPLTYAVYPWFVHCECALMKKKRQIFKFLQFQDKIFIDSLLFVGITEDRFWFKSQL